MNSLTKKISNNLKLLRNKRGWSLDVTSKKTSVSKSMLGQIERGESSPTIETLWKIVAGFDISFSSFVDNLEPIEHQLIHHSQYIDNFHPKDDNIKIRTIFPYDQQLGFEVFIIDLLPGCKHLSPPHQINVIEHIIVLNGKIEVLVDGIWNLVNQNEGVHFNASKPHGYRNISNSKASFHNIIHYVKS